MSGRGLLASALVLGAALGAAIFAMTACVGYLDADAGAPTNDGGTAKDGSATDDAPVTRDASADGGCTRGAYACAVLEDHPLIYLRLDEPPNTATARDSSGHGIDGTYPSAGVTLGVPSALDSDPADHAVTFVGSGTQQIEMPEGADFVGASFSIEAWIKPDDPTPLQFITDHERFDTRGGWTIDIQDGDLGLELYANDSSFLVVSSKNHALGAGTWHHMVVTYDAKSGQGSVYIDKVLSTQQRYRDDVLPTVGKWFIGKQNCTPCSGSELKGSFDELAVYDYVLFENRVQAHYAASGH